MQVLSGNGSLPPLFCVPLLVKDNMETVLMAASNGAASLLDNIAPKDCFVVGAPLFGPPAPAACNYACAQTCDQQLQQQLPIESEGCSVEPGPSGPGFSSERPSSVQLSCDFQADLSHSRRPALQPTGAFGLSHPQRVSNAQV